jgi:hypothetical protein
VTRPKFNEKEIADLIVDYDRHGCSPPVSLSIRSVAKFVLYCNSYLTKHVTHDKMHKPTLIKIVMSF